MSEEEKNSPPPPPPPTQEAETIDPVQIATHSQKPTSGRTLVIENEMSETNNSKDE